MKFAFFALIFTLLPSPFCHAAKKVPVLVWDTYFNQASPLWPKEPNQGSWGETFLFSADVADRPFKVHGLQIAYVIQKENPGVIVHKAHSPAIPGQDPEYCSLVEDNEFRTELESHGYAPLEDCRSRAHDGINALIRFIQKNQIEIVNMSHGIYFDHYVLRNPELIRKKFPAVNEEKLQKFLYKNFIAIGELVKEVFAKNPGTIFVLAAGNNDDEVDRDLFPKWYEDPQKPYPFPTLFSNFTSQFENVISLASSYDGEKIAPGSNYGKKNVFLAKKIGAFSVPDEKGNFILFGGTSAAAAETSRMLSFFLQKFGNQFSPGEIKKLLAETAKPLHDKPWRATTAGLVDEAAFFQAAQSKGISKLPVEKMRAEFSQFTLPSESNPRGYGCHSLVFSPLDGNLWMTMPWANMILSFNPRTETFKNYILPTPESRPDGITVDKEGRLWFGTDPNGGLVMLDPRDEKIHEFPHPKLSTLNITSTDSRGRIWSTGHRAQTISLFDPLTKTYLDHRVRMDWPLDIQVDASGEAWATALKGYEKPWGQGALVHASGTSEGLEYFPLPKREEPLQAFWLSHAANQIGISLMRDGFILFNKENHGMQQFQRSDGSQMYNIVRTAPDGSLVFSNAHEKMKSFDFVDALRADRIRSLELPNQEGEPREALTFDGEGNLWYCQNFTNILGRARLSKP